jgi:hypothetical protein
MANPESATLEWYDKTEQPPCMEDADNQGCVIAWHTFDGVLITGWRYVMQNSFITHWFPTPMPPEDMRKLASDCKSVYRHG